jgi:hypothetical protein
MVALTMNRKEEERGVGGAHVSDINAQNRLSMRTTLPQFPFLMSGNMNGFLG